MIIFKKIFDIRYSLSYNIKKRCVRRIRLRSAVKYAHTITNIINNKMKRVYDFLKEAKVYYLATMDGDQARVRPFGTVDLFTCTFDTVNHLNGKEDVQKLFDRVSLFLHPDGVFIFDMNTFKKAGSTPT